MLEAQVQQAVLWKHIIECINGLVNEVNFDCNPGGLSIQAMDSNHVALVHMLLREDCFIKYQCERNSMLGVNLVSLSKILKSIEGNYSLTMLHEEDSDALVITAESPERAKRSEYKLKLLEIEAESMVIPEIEHSSSVKMSSSEFAKIVRDMTVIGDTVSISLSKAGVKFSSSGDLGTGSTFLQAGIVERGTKSNVKSEVKTEGADNEETLPRTKESSGSSNPIGVELELDEPMTLSFSLRFMNVFAKGASLSDFVKLSFAKDAPFVIEYEIDKVGYLRFYLAPKIGDE